MDTLVAAHHHHLYTMPTSVPYSQSPASSTHSSPHMFTHDLASQPRQNSLHISTANAGVHTQDPDEQTAHPSRMPPASRLSLESQGETSSQSSLEEEPSENDIDAAFPGLTRPLTHQERELLAWLDRLKFFLATAPSRWSSDAPTHNPHDAPLPLGHPSPAHPALNRFLLPNSEYVSCVLWGGLYHITGTDIVRALVFRFEAFGRPVRNMKKFEEGVFSDLRNLKPGVDACLEEPKSPFLDLLFKYQCIRTQKKQKVFYWFSVPHDRLFLDALERDLKREKMGLEPTTVVTGEPALSFTYDPKRSLYEQFSKAQGAVEGEGELEAAVRRAEEEGRASDSTDESSTSTSDADMDQLNSSSEAEDSTTEDAGSSSSKAINKKKMPPGGPNFFGLFSIFGGSPTYKQRRKKLPKGLPSSLGLGGVPQRRSPSALPYGHPSSSSLRDSPDDMLMSNGVYNMGGIPSGVSGYRMEPHMDRYGNDTARMSAADMFLAQARGDFSGQSNPDLVATQKERQRRAMQQVAYLSGPGVAPPHPPTPPASGNSAMGFGIAQHPSQMGPDHLMSTYSSHPRHPVERHTFPMANQFTGMRSNTAPFPEPSGWPPAGTIAPMTSEPMAIPRTKAFVCPLFSCGRMFKRMEHLKRHLRTHTLERPFQYASTSSISSSENGTMAGSMDGIGTGSESEEIDELEGDDGAIEDAMYGMGIGVGVGRMPDVQMCEVEIQGSIQEVQGDEEGLVLPAGTVTQSANLAALTSIPPPEGTDSPSGLYFNDTDSASWSNGSVSSSLPSQSRMATNGSPSTSYLNDFGSMSAPAHKVGFEHASLYPPELNPNGGLGPIRRHRSATPSVRYGDSIRRPYSTVSDHGSSASSSSSRSYHPYATNSVPHSAESSPMNYSIALDPYEPGMVSSRPNGTHSRSSSAGHHQQQLQDHMHQMLQLERMDTSAPGGDISGIASFGTTGGVVTGYQRTDSPMHFMSADVQETDSGAFLATGVVDPHYQQQANHFGDATFYPPVANLHYIPRTIFHP
ncbi:STE12 transcription factor family protein [Abortiporus biennis]